VQATEPLALFHLPTPQDVHLAPSQPVCPARQIHVELLTYEKELRGQDRQLALATSVEYVFTPQAVQSTDPVTFLYVPTPQGVHATPSDEAVYPTRHVQNTLLSTEKVLFGHTRQVVDATAATADE
jgi:hypothetical protein